MSVGPSATHRPHVLILEHQLRELGCDVELAANGLQAMEKAAAQPFHLILMDCQLPDIDGYTVTERIRARESGTGVHTPILAISSDTDDEHQQRVMTSGMDGMLTKPIRPDVLRGMLELWCETRSAAHAAVPVSEDRDLWSIYLDSLDEDLESLARALAAGDPAAAHHAAHRIKGAALTVEQPAIAERARALEAALTHAGTMPADAPHALAELRRLRDALHMERAAG